MLWNYRTAIVLLLISLFSAYSCREDFDYDLATGGLTFSSDTIMLDTVFSQSKSETFAVKIYNRSDSDLEIPSIRLDRGNGSFYNLNVNGIPGKSFENVPIQGEDSLFVFVEIEVSDVDMHQAYEDEIIIDQGNTNERVKLISYIEKAQYYIADDLVGDIAINETNWDSSSSRVIYGNAVVNNQLNVSAGTRVYFADGSGMLIKNGGQLNIAGSLEEKVVFRGIRHTPRYDSLPKIWGKLKLEQNVQATINYLRLQNSEGGLEVSPNANLDIQNSEFYNNQNFGIYAINATIEASNLILSNSNLASLAIDQGGEYNFVHCTFANYFEFDAGPRYSAFLSNSFSDETSNESFGDLNVNFGNCLFYGEPQGGNAIVLDQRQEAAFNYTFTNCLIQNGNPDSQNFMSDGNVFNGIFEDPLFVDTNAEDGFFFGVDEESPARNNGSSSVAQQSPMDFFGRLRSTTPTIGAIE